MVEVSLRTANRGRFEVTLDDRPVFSKAQLSRFPNPGEVLGLLQPALGAPIAWR